MRNAAGVVRSGEFLKAHPEQAPKLHHMRIMPHADGVRVTHHSSADGKLMADHHFSHGDGAGLLAHLQEHVGFKGGAGASEPDGEAPGDPGDEV